MTLFLSGNGNDVIGHGEGSGGKGRGRRITNREVGKQDRHWALLESKLFLSPSLVDSASQVSLPTPLLQFCHLSP